MSRKAKTKPATKTIETVDTTVLDKQSKNADKLNQHLTKIDTTYGDSLPYDPIRLINETRFYLQESATTMLEAGKRMILLKEHEPDGEFTRALEQIGIAPRAARKMMQAAVKFSGGKRPLAAALNKTKLLELVSEDDEDLEALAKGGTLAGFTLDEMERMTKSELRNALRKEREKRAQDKETNERMLTSKNKKIDKLDKRVHELESHTRPWPQRCTDINTEVTTAAFSILESMDQLDVLRDSILTEQFDDEERESALEMMAVMYYDAVNQIAIKFDDLTTACEDVFSGYKPV